LGLEEGAMGRKLEKGREIASGAPSSNWQSQASGGLRTVGVAEQVVREIATKEAGIPFGSRRIWAAYPGGLRLNPSGLSESGSKLSSESSPLPRPNQSREFRADVGHEALCPGHTLVQESFFVCSVKGLGEIGGLGNLYLETVVDKNCRLAFAKVCGSQSPLNAVNILQTCVLPFYERYDVRIERVFTPNSREFCGLIPTHPYEFFLASAEIKHAHFGPGQDSLRVACWQLYRILCEEFFAPEFRRTFRHSFGTLQRALDLFLEAYNRERVVRDGSKPSRTPLGLFWEGIGLAMQSEPGSESKLSTANL
jgi:hypothetical protein